MRIGFIASGAADARPAKAPCAFFGQMGHGGKDFPAVIELLGGRLSDLA